ncbi:MAG: aminotransferase [Candidatus Schekmanbacteria bacterium RBG_16_38_10]|uniref:Aminotransferase n=1 Tax=Candidatus Schekmanbacteria bacterium RBG_16_38_10 TaxID=1817879 RepID=A0A1F7S1V3_9BACT|nr:MAG: aminotransferase [Candidatus Schekmanbacteria bacterium RBG_16_38_10]
MIKPFENPIYVTRPFLPSLGEFCKGLEEIWENQWLTNNGPILQRFTQALSNFFETDNICLFNNGTLALQIALQGMGISGEVITTPYTFVATTHALFWNKIRPIFVDIEPEYYTLDPEKVEAAITPWTTAILAVHVYGHPCKLDALADIARRHNLRLIYDAAHAFGIKVGDKPIAHFGDLSMFSFHSTKLFHSIEGGMLIFKEAGLKGLFDYLKNFGFKNEVEVVMPGTNAKMNEMQALMGIQVLKYLEEIIKKREQITYIYRNKLKEVPGIRLVPALSHNIQYNYAYMPIEVVEKEFGMNRNILYEKLKEWNVHTRRYFYPLICDYPCYRSISVNGSLPVARRVSDRILTLPIYDSLELCDVETICDIIMSLQQGMRTNRMSLKQKEMSKIG